MIVYVNFLLSKERRSCSEYITYANEEVGVQFFFFFSRTVNSEDFRVMLHYKCI